MAVARAPKPFVFSECRGARTAAPTVILESGAFGSSSDWAHVLPELASGGRVCAYDRGGIGRSKPRAGRRDVVSVAWELFFLLDQLDEHRPVILVGHSNGGLYIETFAAIWPERVAGLVYVNAVTSDALDYPPVLDDLASERRLSNLAVVAHGLGLAPLIARQLVGDLHLIGPDALRKQASLTSILSLKVARDEDVAILPGLSTARELGGSPPTIATVVVVAQEKSSTTLSRAYEAAQKAPALRAKTAWSLQAPGGTHVSMISRDRAYVLAAVEWLRSLPHPDIGH